MMRSLRGPQTLFALALIAGGAAQAQAQNAVISGRVTSEQGQPLQGANVYITELNLSVGTNATGNYTITVPAARVSNQSVMLRARSVGFTPQSRQITIRPGAQTEDFTLRPDVTRLSEVVVTGVTGATERIKVPFSVSRVDSSSMPVQGANPLAQLQGKVPGANIVSSSGRPGAAPAVLLRGPRSINAQGRGQDPMYIVDGVILQGSLADIDPRDIESVEVVKGAAAASLYGSRAGAGVIQITTKSGKNAAEGVRVGVRAEYGTSDVEREFKIAQRHALMMDETQTRFCIDAVQCASTINWTAENLRINDNATDYASAPPLFPIDLGSTLSGTNGRRLYQSNPWPGNNYNAIAQLVQPQPMVQTNIDVQGRLNNTSFYASANLLDQGGAISYLRGYERQAGRINVGHRFNDQWSLDATSYFARISEDGSNQEGGGAAFFRLTRVPPIVDLTRTDSRGRLLIRPNLTGGGAQNENPLYSLQNVLREDITNRFIGGATLRYDPLDWLQASGTFGYDNSDGTYKQFQNRGFRTTGPNPSTANNGLVFNGALAQRAVNSSFSLTATPDLVADLATRFNVRALYEQRDITNRNFQGTQLSVSDVEAGQNAGQSTLSVASSVQSTRQIGFAGGIDLDWRDRYIISGLVRTDGSSLFGADQQWRTYGRGSVAWIASNEDWWAGLSDRVGLLKFSASYGTAGISPSFAAQYETYTIGSGGTLTPATLGNRNLRPEYVRELELNAEAELFGRLGVALTYSDSKNEDQILQVPLPAAQGFSTQWRNAGTLENKVWELSLNLPVIQRPDASLSFRLTGDITKSTITKLDVEPYFIGPGLQATESMFRIAEGETYGTFYGRKFVSECSELPGAFAAQCGSGRAFQRNDDGFIVWVGEGNTLGDGITKNLWQTTLPASQAPFGTQAAWGHLIVLRDSLTGAGRSVPLGQALPERRLGFATTASWRDFGAYMLLDGAFGQSVWNQARHWSFLDFLSGDQDQVGRSVNDAKPTSYYYRAGPPDNGSGIGGLYDVLGPNSYFVEKADYVKLREVALSYNIGPIANTGNWTLGLIGRNLLTFSDYKGFDPEVGVTGGQTGSTALNAVDAFTFPNLRTFTFSISTSF